MSVNSDGMNGNAQLWPGLTASSTRLRSRQQLAAVTGDLVSEFSSLLPAGAVVRQVMLARELLLSAGVRAGLPEATSAMARARLRRQLEETSGRPPMAGPPLIPEQAGPAGPSP